MDLRGLPFFPDTLGVWFWIWGGLFMDDLFKRRSVHEISAYNILWIRNLEQTFIITMLFQCWMGPFVTLRSQFEVLITHRRTMVFKIESNRHNSSWRKSLHQSGVISIPSMDHPNFPRSIVWEESFFFSPDQELVFHYLVARAQRYLVGHPRDCVFTGTLVHKRRSTLRIFNKNRFWKFLENVSVENVFFLLHGVTEFFIRLFIDETRTLDAWSQARRCKTIILQQTRCSHSRPRGRNINIF